MRLVDADELERKIQQAIQSYLITKTDPGMEKYVSGAIFGLIEAKNIVIKEKTLGVDCNADNHH